MAARLGLRLSLDQLIIGLWRPWDGAVKRSTCFPPCQKILDAHWSPLASMNQHPEATKSNNDCQLGSSDYEIADKNHLHYFWPDVDCSYLSSFRIKIQCVHHPDGHIAKAWRFHTLSTEETQETEFLRIHEADLPKINSFGSGIRNQPLKMNPCANHIAHVADSLCSMPRIIVCPSCNLVSYCSDGCRMQNWEKHRGCQLPEHFQGSLTVYLNDCNPKIAFRNLLMLELLRFYGFEAIDTVIALWSSVLLTGNQLLVCDNAARTLLDRTLLETEFPEMHFSGSRVTATLADVSSPLDGWDPTSLLVTATRENLPPMDLYGHLSFHLLERLSTSSADYIPVKFISDYPVVMHQAWPPSCKDSAHQISTSRLTEVDLREVLVGISAQTSDDPGFAKLLARGLQHGDLSLVHYFDNSSKAFLPYLDSRSADRIGKSGYSTQRSTFDCPSSPICGDGCVNKCNHW
ncbi:unnamed protein product [Sphagnum troendelagicum]|uniref:MYND-type domain-containing protein n=1 Tax=Sphagnum troendelagicum TaxID=128251 RepID=A0ABP0V0W2_9BRYO